MYIPTAFRIEDIGKLTSFIGQHSFATLITSTDEGPFASHIPLLLDRSSHRLLGHLAIANPQWRHFATPGDVLAIFQGPHAYVSPRWYQTTPAVPTWSYAAVHIYGKARVIEDPAGVIDVVQRTVQYFEGDGPDAWDGRLPADYQARMLKGIVAFEIAITRIEGKFKLGQNRDRADRKGVYEALKNSANEEERRLAELILSEGLVDG